MFIEVNGHLVNEHSIIQITPNGGVQLAGNSVIHVTDEAELANLRYRFAPVPEPMSEPKADSTEAKNEEAK